MVVFVIICVSLLKKALTKQYKKTTSKKFYKQFIIAVCLFVLLGLAWGAGLAASQQPYTHQIVIDILSGVFICLTGFHGVFIFILHCLRNESIRELWRNCFHKKSYGITKKAHHSMSSFKSSRTDSKYNFPLKSSSLNL